MVIFTKPEEIFENLSLLAIKRYCLYRTQADCNDRKGMKRIVGFQKETDTDPVKICTANSEGLDSTTGS